MKLSVNKHTIVGVNSIKEVVEFIKTEVPNYPIWVSPFIDVPLQSNVIDARNAEVNGWGKRIKTVTPCLPKVVRPEGPEGAERSV